MNISEYIKSLAKTASATPQGKDADGVQVIRLNYPDTIELAIVLRGKIEVLKGKDSKGNIVEVGRAKINSSEIQIPADLMKFSIAEHSAAGKDVKMTLAIGDSIAEVSRDNDRSTRTKSWYSQGTQAVIDGSPQPYWSVKGKGEIRTGMGLILREQKFGERVGDRYKNKEGICKKLSDQDHRGRFEVKDIDLTESIGENGDYLAYGLMICKAIGL